MVSSIVVMMGTESFAEDPPQCVIHFPPGTVWPWNPCSGYDNNGQIHYWCCDGSCTVGCGDLIDNGNGTLQENCTYDMECIANLPAIISRAVPRP